MPTRFIEVFDDEALVRKIQRRLPYLFQLAELESSRAGRVGMEVGSLREQIIIALLIYKFGEENIDTNIPITQPEVDVKLFGEPLSIKTITGSGLSGVKLIWTVDARKAEDFKRNYNPSCDMLLIQINWGGEGGLYYIPLDVQSKCLDELGRDKYIKLPKVGTNPRGVEIGREALGFLVNDPQTKKISIIWRKIDIKFNPYKRWVELWEEENET
jgi:hypothetical protein